MHTKIKFCGMTGPADVELARSNGATHIGMIFARSPRRISWEAFEAIASGIGPVPTPVAVFVDPSPDDVRRVLAALPSALLQFGGTEEPDAIARYGERAIKVVHVRDGDDRQSLRRRCNRYPEATVMFDTGSSGRAGGTGVPFAWDLVEQIARERPTWIAGGLNPSNVAACIDAVRPFGVDVRSGIESEQRKDPMKMRAFTQAVRDSDAT